MKNLFSILKYIKGYWNYAILNITFNIISVVFSLFSIGMLFPFLQLLFSGNNKSKIQAILSAGKPEIHFSADGVLDYLNYYLANIIHQKGAKEALVLICLVIVISIFLKNLFRYLGQYFIAPIRNGVVKDLRNDIYTKVLELPLAYYSEQRKGDIISRMSTDVLEIEWAVMKSLEMLFREPINILLFLGAMIFISPMLTLFVIIILPITGIFIGLIAKSLRKDSAEGKEKLGIMMSIIEETLTGLRIVKAFNAEGILTNRFKKVNKKYNDIEINMYRKIDLSSPLSEFLGVVAFVIILYIGVSMALGGTSTISGAVLITFLGIFSQLISPAKAITTAYYNVQRGLASSERINIILDAENHINEKKNAQQLSALKHSIEYENVSFAYQSEYVLQNINLKLEKGKTIALVGKSGGGKSTLADLLPRFYDVKEGAVKIDGIDVRDIKVSDLRNLMGIVTQESILFNDTVFNNISLGRSNVKELDVIEAAKIANADDFISALTEGYQTNVGDSGSKLSGGQRQRIAIARAVLKNPAILILDEATSALDTESERVVQEALDKLMKNRTSLVIAHRLSTIQKADEIIVLENGKIVQRGSHSELLTQAGVYKKLVSMQSFSS